MLPYVPPDVESSLDEASYVTIMDRRDLFWPCQMASSDVCATKAVNTETGHNFLNIPSSRASPVHSSVQLLDACRRDPRWYACALQLVGAATQRNSFTKAS